MESISTKEARRLALAKAGLLKQTWTQMPARARGAGKRARTAALRIIRRFGYLQLDTVAIAGARSHAIVLLSRLDGFEPQCAECLLQPGQPVFEYWGHEASWLPMELYPLFEFRRREYATHPWWGDLITEHPKVATGLVQRIRAEGPLRSLDMEGSSRGGWWDLKLTKRVAAALWSAGQLAICERRSFQRSFDLTERVIPAELLDQSVSKETAIEHLLLRALKGHGWATTSTLSQTWRLRHCRAEIKAALKRLVEKEEIIPCALDDGARLTAGWVTPEDAGLAERLGRSRPRRDVGILLSPFDPVLWDRNRVKRLFGFDQVLEIFKPAPQRVYGYYCLPILAGDAFVGRVDLKADQRKQTLRVLSLCLEEPRRGLWTEATQREAVASALGRYSRALGMELCGMPSLSALT